MFRIVTLAVLSFLLGFGALGDEDKKKPSEPKEYIKVEARGLIWKGSLPTGGPDGYREHIAVVVERMPLPLEFGKNKELLERAEKLMKDYEWAVITGTLREYPTSPGRGVVILHVTEVKGTGERVKSTPSQLPGGIKPDEKDKPKEKKPVR